MVTELISVVALIGALYIAIPVVLIERWRKRKKLQPATSDSRDSVSVIFAARNEERNITTTLRSLLTQEYKPLEIVVADDLSEDRTGEIIRRIAADHSEVCHVAIRTLPEGWLGKCHALREGFAVSTGRWLLFTDADVEFDSEAVGRAVASAEMYEADHLVVFPQLLSHGKTEAGLLAFFTMMLGVGFRFWRVESVSLDAYVGIGAFNMIRRDLYERFGGHEALRLEIADDMKLGYLAKKYGGRSVPLYGEGRVRVRWREGARDIVRGIIRSGFPGMNFNWWRLLFAVTGILLVFLSPFVVPVIDPSPLTVLLSALTVFLCLLSVGLSAHSQSLPLRTALLYPISAGLFLWGIFLSALIATVQGGVRWRDTFYSIEELKKGSVR